MPNIKGPSRAPLVQVPRHFWPDGKADPAAYALIAEGTCLEPEIIDGDHVVCSPNTPLAPGKFVIVWLHRGKSVIKRLVSMPPGGLRQFSGPKSDVMAAVVVEMLNPKKQIVIAADRIKAIHAVVGHLHPDEIKRALPKAEDFPKRKKLTLADLPFVAPDGASPPGPTPRGLKRSWWWNVTSSGDSEKDCEKGRDYAELLLDYISDSGFPGALGYVLMSMCDIERASPDLAERVVIGFAEHIGIAASYGRFHAKNMRLQQRTVVAMAEAREHREQSSRGRHAARVRWAKRSPKKRARRAA